MALFRIQIDFNHTKSVMYWDRKLIAEDSGALAWLQERARTHIPVEVLVPGGVDYENDLSKAENAYHAILTEFSSARVLKELKGPSGVIY